MSKVMMRIGLSIMAAAGLAGCGLVDNGTAVQYGGMTFKGASEGNKADRAQFVSTGGPVSASIDGASRAAAYQGTVYCINVLGTSDVDWQIGPDTPQGQMPVARDDVVFRGRCVE
ncbi:hypothetical protein [Salipiger aestuarii]|nr:hypothetical protein [Salipiger aestuarii]